MSNYQNAAIELLHFHIIKTVYDSVGGDGWIMLGSVYDYTTIHLSGPARCNVEVN